MINLPFQTSGKVLPENEERRSRIYLQGVAMFCCSGRGRNKPVSSVSARRWRHGSPDGAASADRNRTIRNDDRFRAKRFDQRRQCAGACRRARRAAGDPSWGLSEQRQGDINVHGNASRQSCATGPRKEPAAGRQHAACARRTQSEQFVSASADQLRDNRSDPFRNSHQAVRMPDHPERARQPARRELLGSREGQLLLPVDQQQLQGFERANRPLSHRSGQHDHDRRADRTL
jgi:hypothetical protein